MTSPKASPHPTRPRPAQPALASAETAHGLYVQQAVYVATGILTIRHRLDAAAALDLLQECCGRARRDIADVADEVVRTGALVGLASRPGRHYAYPPTPLIAPARA